MKKSDLFIRPLGDIEPIRSIELFFLLTVSLNMKEKIVLTHLLLGGSLVAFVPLPAKAADFDLSQYDYTQLENITTRPLQSDNQLFLSGDPADNQGFTAFFNLDFTAPDVGHVEISRNSPGNIAPYYTTGKSASPEEPSTGTTRSSSLTDILGFSSFSSYLNDNTISLNSIGLGYGQREGKDFTQTWNLGDDEFGKDWFADSNSTVEERIYTANPDDVEIFLVQDTTKILSFGYSDFYNILEYGETPEIDDDFDAIFSDPFSVAKVDGLDPLLSGLADSFLQDVDSSGGGIQAVYEESQVQDPIFSVGNGFGVLSFPFPMTLRAVPLEEAEKVPEPSIVLGLSMFGLWGLVGLKRKTKLSQ